MECDNVRNAVMSHFGWFFFWTFWGDGIGWMGWFCCFIKVLMKVTLLGKMSQNVAFTGSACGLCDFLFRKWAQTITILLTQIALILFR